MMFGLNLARMAAQELPVASATGPGDEPSRSTEGDTILVSRDVSPAGLVVWWLAIRWLTPPAKSVLPSGLLPNLLASFATLLLIGCTSDATPKTSLFEDDHAIAAHWPVDLSDISIKLRQRLGAEMIDDETMHEIKDLVSWTAEIAADTNLAEADWLPIYHATESLTANLQSAGGSLTDQNRQQLESLCDLVDDAANKIPEQLPYLAKGNS
ncbi:hypothetical protein FHS27_000649 [Rhodopirellula rubra]|uniref:Uncharacterized protein n=1 Tax=Aporhodopirellula rubra TaxID=980271 RepID=A0A7W5DVD2_9BACT|nr:hypothetical protein [Aporhodopirellula rubra]MBB3204882.1 hypothetical protein [Aporhodopirellula rubra]